MTKQDPKALAAQGRYTVMVVRHGPVYDDEVELAEAMRLWAAAEQEVTTLREQVKLRRRERERWRSRVKGLVCTAHLANGDCCDACVLCEIERLRGGAGGHQGTRWHCAANP